MELTPIFVLAIIFGSILTIVYLGIRKKERMAMLEKGVDASYFVKKKTGDPGLKFGLLFIGVALGIFSGSLVHQEFGMQEEPAHFSMIFLFAGLALVISHFIEKHELNKD